MSVFVIFFFTLFGIALFIFIVQVGRYHESLINEGITLTVRHAYGSKCAKGCLLFYFIFSDCLMYSRGPNLPGRLKAAAQSRRSN